MSTDTDAALLCLFLVIVDFNKPWTLGCKGELLNKENFAFHVSQLEIVLQLPLFVFMDDPGVPLWVEKMCCLLFICILAEIFEERIYIRCIINRKKIIMTMRKITIDNIGKYIPIVFEKYNFEESQGNSSNHSKKLLPITKQTIWNDLLNVLELMNKHKQILPIFLYWNKINQSTYAVLQQKSEHRKLYEWIKWIPPFFENHRISLKEQGS